MCNVCTLYSTNNMCKVYIDGWQLRMCTMYCVHCTWSAEDKLLLFMTDRAYVTNTLTFNCFLLLLSVVCRCTCTEYTRRWHFHLFIHLPYLFIHTQHLFSYSFIYLSVWVIVGERCATNGTQRNGAERSATTQSGSLFELLIGSQLIGLAEFGLI